MRKSAMAVMVVLLVAVGLFAQQKSVAGSWKVSMETPHGSMVADLQLKLEGSKVTGVLVIAQHGDLDVSGEFSDGILTLSSDENGYMQMSLKGKLGGDGTMTGTLKSPMGEASWTATRS